MKERPVHIILQLADKLFPFTTTCSVVCLFPQTHFNYSCRFIKHLRLVAQRKGMAIIMKGKISKKQHYIPERLKNQLAEIPQHSLTVVEAPSGFGKTTAIRACINENHANDVRAYWYI